MKGHNNPPVTIELSAELFEFLTDNCEANLEYGLKTLRMIHSQDLLEKQVAQMEKFKELRKILKDARHV